MHNTDAALHRELQEILANGALETHFQPILDARGERIQGHEALSRGPAGSLLRPPLELIRVAELAGLGEALDLAMIERAIERFAGSAAPGQLFINVQPTTVLCCTDFVSRLDSVLRRVRFKPRRLVLEITEHGQGEEVADIAEQARQLRALGCEIAIDDLGAGSSGLKIWSVLRPDYVKIDRYFISQITHDAVVAEVLRSMLDMAHVMGSRVVAEGVENEAQLRLLRDIGVDYLQGYHLYRPLESPLCEPERRGPATGEFPLAASCAEELLINRPALAPETRIEEVAALFRKNADWHSLAVVKDGRPVGIARRDSLLTLLSKPLYPEIYNRKPIATTMEPDPLVVDARARLDQVSRILTGGKRPQIHEDFIIARHGEYIGFGSTVELLRQITAQQVQIAQQSNPLTSLPGNRQIEDHLTRLLALRQPFVICHADLDNFKPFNDEYGYRHGDQVLLHVADLMRKVIAPSADFVGHVGGDDFILMLRTGDWNTRLARLFDHFCASVPNFYTPEHRESGAICGLDRHGQRRAFPLMSLSLGVVLVEAGWYPGKDAIDHTLKRTKTLAKAQEGNAMVIDRNGSIETCVRDQLLRGAPLPLKSQLSAAQAP